MKTTIWYLLRMTRSNPPGIAGAGDRVALYRSAMQQFEDLVEAAAASGPAGRPLPLFYAASQAGRALLASREPDDAVVFAGKEHHGLSLSRAKVVAGSVLHSALDPVRPDVGHFQRVATAVGSDTLDEPIEIGRALASLPDAGDELFAEESWPTALAFWPLNDMSEVSGRGRLSGGKLDVALVGADAGTQAKLDALAASYPTLVSCDPQLPVMFPQRVQGRWTVPTPSGPGSFVELSVPAGSTDLDGLYQSLLERFAPEYRWIGRRWVRPGTVSGHALPNPLMTWWIVLFGLSSLARYHPAAWTEALDVNASSVAVSLERTLDVALEALPHLVLDALHMTSSPLLVSPGPDTPPVSH